MTSENRDWPAIIRWVFTYLLISLAISAAALFYIYRDSVVWAYWAAAGIGFVVGMTEMIARYRDAPFAPLRSAPGLIYFAINGGAAALAYYLLGALDVEIASEPLKVFTAGIGAMAFFRSGIFTVRIGEDDVSVGPHLILQIILQALDRTYDRDRAEPRSLLIVKIMSGVSFEEARTALPSICFNLMQNAADSEKEEVGREVEALVSADMSEEAKTLILGLALFNVVGAGTLRAAVDALGNTVRGSKKIKEDIILQMAKVAPTTIISSLPTICNELSDESTRLEDAATLTSSIVALSVPDESKAVLTVHKLVRQYGEGTVRIALGTLSL